MNKAFVVPTIHMFGVAYRDETTEGYTGFGWNLYLFETEIERESMVRDLENGHLGHDRFVPFFRMERDIPITVYEQHKGEQEALNRRYSEMGEDYLG